MTALPAPLSTTTGYILTDAGWVPKPVGAPVQQEYSGGQRVEDQVTAPYVGIAPADFITGGEEQRGDYDTIIARHYAAVASLVRNPAKKAKALRAAQSPQTTLSDTGAAVLSSSIAALFTDAAAPYPSAIADVVATLTQDVAVAVPVSSVITGDVTDSVAVDAYITNTPTPTHSVSIDSEIATTLLNVVSFRWGDDAASPNWYPLDRPASDTFEAGGRYILAVRVKMDGTDSIPSPGSDLVLQFSGSSVSTSNDETEGWTTATNSTKVQLANPATFTYTHGDSVAVNAFVCNPGGNTPVPGVFASSAQVGLQLQFGEETELWFCLDPDDFLGLYMFGRITALTAGVQFGDEFAPAGAWSNVGS